MTSILARTSRSGRKVANSPVDSRWKARLGDSKDLVAFGHDALGEAWGRAIAMRCGVGAETPDELLQALFLDGQAKLRARCPTQHEEQCWSTRDERFRASDALVAAVANDLAALEKAGVDVVRCRVAVVCVERLNDAVDRGKSRLDVDLNAMERLVVAARGDAGEDLLATCGKVGGIDRYPSRFDALASYLVSSIEEGRARSAYRVAGIGEVAFVRDADASNMLVGMASLVGKWVRDGMMERVVRYHQRDVPTAPTVSGYNDPKTARFIDETALSRKTRNMPDRCFERRRIGELPKVLPISADAQDAARH